MPARRKGLVFTAAELGLLLTILHDHQSEGSYYGAQMQWRERVERMIQKLLDEVNR